MSKLAYHTKSKLARSFYTPKEYLDYANDLYDERRYNDALEYYDEAVKLALKSNVKDYVLISLATNNKADAIGMLGRDDESLVLFDEAIEYTKKYADNEYDLSDRMAGKACIYRDLGNLEESISLSNEAISIYHTPCAYVNKALTLKDKGEALEKKGLQHEATKVFIQALNVVEEGMNNCSEGNFCFTKGQCLHALGRYDEAIAAYKEYGAAKGQQAYDMAYFATIANSYVKAGNYKEAVKCLKKTKELYERDGQYLTEFQANDIKASLSHESDAIEFLCKYVDELEISQETNGTGASSFKQNIFASSALLSTISGVANGTEIDAVDFAKLRFDFEEMKKQNQVQNQVLQPIIKNHRAVESYKAKLDYINDPSNWYLRDYSKAFITICTSYYGSAKAADGEFTQKNLTPGIPNVDTIASVIPIQAITAGIAVIQAAVKVVQYIKNSNDLARLVNSSSTSTRFDAAVEEIAVKITHIKEETIREACRAPTKAMLSIFKKFTEIQGKVLVDNYNTTAKQLGFQDAMKAIRFIYTGHFKVDGTDDEIMSSKNAMIIFLTSDAAESALVRALASGIHLKPESKYRGDDHHLVTDDKYSKTTYDHKHDIDTKGKHSHGKKCMIMNVQTEDIFVQTMNLFQENNLIGNLEYNGSLDQYGFDFSDVL